MDYKKPKYPRRRRLTKEDEKLAQRIKELRTQQGLSQEELSGRLGHNLAYIAYIETLRSGLSLPILYKLAKVLQVQVRDLFTF